MTITIGTGGTDTTAVAMDIVMIPTIGGIAADMIVMIIGGTVAGVIVITTMINFALTAVYLEDPRRSLFLKT